MSIHDFTLTVGRTDKGLALAEFLDLYGSHCSVQKSSLSESDTIWLGVMVDMDGRRCTRMHLDQDMVEALIPILQRFVATGEIHEVPLHG